VSDAEGFGTAGIEEDVSVSVITALVSGVWVCDVVGIVLWGLLIAV